jgi:hypothetical protein
MIRNRCDRQYLSGCEAKAYLDAEYRASPADNTRLAA